MIQLCLIAFAAIPQTPLDSPELQMKVDFRSAAAPATSVITALARQTKLRMSASANHGLDIVYVNAKDVSIAEVMARIASVTSGEWQRNGNDYRLVRTAAIEKKEAAEESESRTKRLEGSLAELTKRSSPARPIPPQGVVGAFQRIIPNLLAKIGVPELASIEPGQRVVYASTPNRMQRPLKLSHDQVLGLIVENFNYYRSERQVEQNLNTITEVLNRWVTAEGEPARSHRDPEITLCVHRLGSGLIVDGKAFNFEGRATLASRVYLYENPLFYTPGVKPPLPQVTGPDGPLVLDGPVMEVSDWFTKGGPSPSTKTLQLYSKPDANEPFGFEYSSILDLVAQTKKVNIVANLPDDLLCLRGAWGGALPSTVNPWLAELLAEPSISGTQKDGWLTIAPSAPSSARSGRVKRSALARLFGTSIESGNARLADIAVFAQAEPKKAFANVTVPLYLMFCPNVLVMGEKLNDWDFLQLFAALSQEQQRTIQTGGTLALEAMSPPQRSLLQEMVYSAETARTLEEGFMETLPPQGNMPERKVPTWRGEPTELMPDGVPGRFLLRSTVTESQAAIYPRTTGSFRSGSMSPDLLGYYVMSSEASGIDGRTRMKVAVGKRRMYRCELEVAPGVILRKTLGDDIYEPGATFQTWDQLPATFRDAVEKGVVAARERRDSAPKLPPKPPSD